MNTHGHMFALTIAALLLTTVVKFPTAEPVVSAAVSDSDNADKVLAVQPMITSGYLHVKPNNDNDSVQHHILTLIGTDSMIMVNDMMPERAYTIHNASVSTSSSSHSSTNSSFATTSSTVYGVAGRDIFASP